MTGAPPPIPEQPEPSRTLGWPLLPPPDLSETYAQLPQSWKTGAVLLANRILAAAYRADVLQVVEQVLRDVESGAIRGMTIEDYLEEQTEGHPRVIDFNRALQTLAYSPAFARTFGTHGAGGDVSRLALRAFRQDVEAELETRGVLGEPGSEGAAQKDLDPGESPF